ncbi:MAG: phage major capsid protein, partial [Ruthenibacterium sp.]
MADILSKGSLFPEELISDLIQKTTGASALAKLCGATPIPFNGLKEFTFQLDKEVDVVAENGAKSKGGVTVEPVTIVPIKVEYGARITDEFLYSSEEAKLDYMSAFADGFAKKVA